MARLDPRRDGVVLDPLDRKLAQSGRQVDQPLEIARSTDVHRVGDRGDRRERRINSGLRPLAERPIGVGCQDDRANRQAHRPRIKRGEPMAQIAGRDDESRLDAARLEQFHRSFGDIGHLRQPAADVDRIGRAQPVRRDQRWIGKRRFHHPLAIVEIAVDLDRGDRIVPAGQLELLERRHPTLRVKDDRADLGQTFGGASDRSARIARGRREHGQRLVPIPEPLETAHQEARAEILERAGRAVKQLERVQTWLGRIRDDERNREIEALRADRAELAFEHIAREERREQSRRERRQPHLRPQ